MRVVVVGATGNVGTSLLASLASDPEVGSVLGLARRLPELRLPKVEWARADVARDDLVPHFRGADCVVHLAWLIQPSHDRNALWLTNVHGSRRVFEAVGEAQVPSLVHASSVGVYSPGPKDRLVDESWPRDGIGTSYYSRHKAESERWLDRFEDDRPEVRVVRLRPGLIFKRESATGQRRLFAGPFLPGPLLRPGLIPFVPDHPRLRFQAVHSLDVGEAYRLAVRSDVRGAFNVAAEPVVTPEELASLLEARRLRVPAPLLRGAAALSWRLHLQPSDVGWVDMGLGVPLMDTSRVREELGWRPRRSSLDALADVLRGLREGADLPTPPLARRTRAEELATGVGSREWKRGS
jgi:nucleoside-diphosphate-sugar epimerase